MLLLPLLLLGVAAALTPHLLRPRIESAASAALGAPVHIAWLGVTSLAAGELGARDVTVGDGDALTVTRLAVRPDLRALLERRLVIERLAIDGLRGTVEQDARGRPVLRGLPISSSEGEASGPEVRVLEIVLGDARVALIPPPELRRTPITLAVDELTLRQVPTADQGRAWEGDLRGTLDGVPLTARARSDRTAGGTRIAAEADLSGAAIDSSRMVLPAGFASLSARASGRLTYELDPEQRRDRLTADVELADLHLTGTQETALAAKLIRTEGATLDLDTGAASLGHVTVVGPRIEAALGAGGLVYPGLVPALVESGRTPPQAAGAASPTPDARTGWRVTGGRVDARDGRITIRRDARDGRSSIRRDAHRVTLDVPAFSWRDLASGRSGDLSLTLRAADGGTVDVDGRLGIDPPTIDATAHLVRVHLPPLADLAEPALALARGTVSGTVAARGDPASPALDVTLEVEQLHTAPPSATDADRVLAVDRLETQLTVAPGTSGEVHVTSLRLSYPYAMIARHAGGFFPLDALARDRAAASPEPTSSLPDPGDPAVATAGTRAVRLDTVTIAGGRIDFVDHTTTPAYWTGLASLEGTVQGASLAPATLDRLDVAALQDELHPLDASLRRTGTQRWEGNASLRGLSRATLNPYLSPGLGYEAETGSVSVALRAALDGAKLAATTAVALDDVGVRQTGLDVIQRQTGVPLSVALGLLADVSGEIALEVPVEIDTATGEYALPSFVAQGIGRALLGALSSPLRWLGMLFGTDGPPHALAINPVPFTAGSGTLDGAGTTRVGQVARILQSHPELDVVLKAQIAVSDRDAVGTAGLTELAVRRVESVRAAFASGRDDAAILASRLIVADWTLPASGALDAAPAVYVEVQSR